MYQDKEKIVLAKATIALILGSYFALTGDLFLDDYLWSLVPVAFLIYESVDLDAGNMFTLVSCGILAAGLFLRFMGHDVRLYNRVFYPASLFILAFSYVYAVIESRQQVKFLKEKGSKEV